MWGLLCLFQRYSRIYTSSALALMGHDRITLKHDRGNLLIDRRTRDHWITGSVVRWQKSHAEAPLAWEVWQKHTLTGCRRGERRPRARVRRRAISSTSGSDGVKLAQGQKCTSDSFHSPHYLMCPPYSLLQAGQQRPRSLLQKTHINILFEFLASHPQQLSDLMTRGSLINSRTLFQVCVVDIE